MNCQKNIILFFSFFASFSFTSGQFPVVLWHGMGDSCCGAFSMGPLMKAIEKEIPGIYIKSIKIGSTEVEDVFNSYFRNVNIQVDEVCTELSSDPALVDGFNAIGFSQGSQFLRALIQRCSGLKVKNFISMAGQHQGVFGLPKCPPGMTHICDYIRKMLSKGAYESHIQNRIVQAEYWHDPLQEDVYKSRSIFLADINQERAINSTYRENLIRLDNFVLVLSANDTVVIPKESGWFGFYKAGQSKDLYTLDESDLYKKDKLGLKVLKDSGRLKFMEVEGDHLHFKLSWFIENIVHGYLM